MKKGETMEFKANEEEAKKLKAISVMGKFIASTESSEFQMVAAMTFINRAIKSPEMHLNACVNSIGHCLNDYMDNDRKALKQTLEGLMTLVDMNIKAKNETSGQE